MTSFLRCTLYMLALLIARPIDEISVGSDEINVMNELNIRDQQQYQQQQQQYPNKGSDTFNQDNVIQKQQHNTNNNTKQQHESMDQIHDYNIQSDSSSSPIKDTKDDQKCGGVLTASHGNIHTPMFPDKFHIPITCVWIIDASELVTGPNISIVVYLTQLYVLNGLKFTEYMYYSDDYKVPSERVYELSEDDVTQVTWIQFTSQYLEIRYTMKTLDGSHLRALDRLLDVYGFNITYEVDAVKSYQCSALKCHFLGHCYAKFDYTSYYCWCFPGFSGSDCGHGPLCQDPEVEFCQNGGTCKHIGDATATCVCPPGFRGNKCELREADNITGCSPESTSTCHWQCPSKDVSSHRKDECRCIGGKDVLTTAGGLSSSKSGRTRYEATIRLSNNLTALYGTPEAAERRISDHLPGLLEKQMSRILRSFNITKINDLELISKSLNGVDITFHFFGLKSDSTKVREAINRMVERGRLGNLTLVSDFLSFQEDPPLQLKTILLDQKSPIRQDSEFVLSCIAQGSPKMTFQWYKDGILVNASKALRDMWSMVTQPEQKSTYSFLLSIPKANRLDEGTYTCEVTDWGVQQCKSIVVKIQTPPYLRVDPPSVTIYRGESLRVRCLSPENDQHRYGHLGYSWTKNGALFQSDPNTVVWEDLYPDGSILKIKNIQKSAEFTCLVSNTIAPVSQSVYVTVIDRGAVELCGTENLYGVQWPASAPGGAILADCPKRFNGRSKRICEQRDFNKSGWLTPDFSECVSDQISDIHIQFQTLTLGYQKTNCSTILKSCLEYVIRRFTKFLPGEAGFLLDLLEQVERYLKVKGTHLEREMASEIILHILDKVMQNMFALNKQQHVEKLQQLAQSAALNRETIAASQLATSTSSSSASQSGAASSSSTFSSSAAASQPSGQGHLSSQSSGSGSPSLSGVGLADSAAVSFPSSQSAIAASSLSDRLNSFRIYTTSVKALPFNLQIYGDDLFTDQLSMEIALTTKLLDILSNSTLFASVISYKNLTDFLPKTYFARGRDGLDTDYMPVSRVIASWLFRANRSNDNIVEPMNLPIETARVEVIFQHDAIPRNTDWTPICGHDSKATFEATWRTDLCITKSLMENITRCICPLSGTFVVLLAKKNYNTSIARTSSRPIFVIISCGCCFLQSCTAFAILIPILYNRKCCITFLKMQFCTSTSTVMAIYILGFLKLLPQDWHGLISSTLASLMLLGVSTLVAITLVIQSELVPRKAQMKNLSSGIRGAVGVSWLLPILFAIGSPLIYTIVGKWPFYWWLETGSSGFILFIIVETLLIGLFVMLFVILIKKLLFLVKKHDKHNAPIWRRLGLLYRTGSILFVKLTTDVLFLIYLNTASNLITSHIFGVFCILLGFSILFCFVIKAEYKLKSEPISKTSGKASIEDNFCSGSINSPLSFYTNHEIEKDNESGPPSSVNTKLPLTILSTSRCSIERLQQTKSVETFLGVCNVGGNVNSNGSKIALGDTGGICDISLHEMEQPITSASSKVTTEKPRSYQSKSRCCNILGASSSKSDDTWEHEINDTRGFYDTYQTSQIKCTLPESHEFVGVETLDILQGVSPDSIIGIRTNISANTRIKTLEPSTILRTTTPKTQKRVTIEEPKKSSQHLPSSSSSISQSTHHLSAPIITITMTGDESSITPDLPLATDSSTSRGSSTTSIRGDGVLNRISHDLDYLLNRTCQVHGPTSDTSGLPQPSPSLNQTTSGQLPPPPPPSISIVADTTTTSAIAAAAAATPSMNISDVASDCSLDYIPPPPLPPAASGLVCSSILSSHCRSVHEVIIEESEQE